MYTAFLFLELNAEPYAGRRYVHDCVGGQRVNVSPVTLVTVFVIQFVYYLNLRQGVVSGVS